MKMMRSAFMKKAIVIAVLFAVITAGAFGQSVPGGFTSPQSQATQGRIRSAADDFIRPDGYTNVSFERWYSMASFASTTQSTLGYATKIGELYLGAFYGGNFWTNINKPAYTEQTNEFADGSANVRVYGNELTRETTIRAGNGTDYTNRPDNTVAVLIGIANMGFRVSFRSTYESFKTDDAAYNYVAQIDNPDFGDPGEPEFLDVPETTSYKSFKTAHGLLSPQIAWSMTKNLLEKGIKPWATLDLAFNRDYTKAETWEYGDTAWTTTVRSANYFAPELNVGAGGFILANKNGWRTSADLEYRLRMTLYGNNEYAYVNSDGNTAVAKFKGRNAGGLSKEKYNDHRIRPIISTQWNGEKLRLRAKLNLNVLLTSSSSDPMVADASGSLDKQGTSSKTFAIGFNPTLELAAQYQLASRLFLNAGGLVNPGTLQRQTTKGSQYSAGSEVADSSYKRVQTDFGNLSNQFSLGVTVNATDNLSVEANTGVSNTASNNVNIFQTDATGAFVFGSVLVSLKF